MVDSALDRVSNLLTKHSGGGMAQNSDRVELKQKHFGILEGLKDTFTWLQIDACWFYYFMLLLSMAFITAFYLFGVFFVCLISRKYKENIRVRVSNKSKQTIYNKLSFVRIFTFGKVT